MDSMGNATTFCEKFTQIRLSDTVIEGMRFDLSHPNLLLLITLVSSSTAIFHFLLKPCGFQVTFISQMLGGIAFGPTFLGRFSKFQQKSYSQKTNLLLNLFEVFGLVYMFFKDSVRVDISIVKKSGRLAVIIGILSAVLPLTVTSLVASLIKLVFRLDEELGGSLQLVIALETLISFNVVLDMLTDLRLLNSELGRLALSSSLISNIFSWVHVSALIAAGQSNKGSENGIHFKTMASFAVLLAIIYYVLRPTLLWMMRETPEGKPLKSDFILAVNMMILGCYFYAQVTGMAGFISSVALGIATPESPPMGSCLISKFEYVIFSAFLPCFIVNVGRMVDFFSIRLTGFLVVESLIVIASSMKFFAGVIPSLCYKMPLSDSLSLGLILNSRGIYDIQTFNRAYRSQTVSQESFSLMVMTAILKSTIILPLLRRVHDSSRRYIAYRKRTIQDSTGYESELRILACIHEANNVPIIFNILQASNPPQRPLGLYVLNLEEYVGRSLPRVIPHRLDKMPTPFKHTRIDLMIHAFSRYQQQRTHFVSVQCFTAIAPCESMHDDICLMAFQKSTSLVIIPFQKTDAAYVRAMIYNVMKMAPCSVGILINRGLFADPRPIFSSRSKIHVGVLFIGGSDDREALAYGARMAEDANIMLTINRFFAMNLSTNDLIEEKNDVNLIHDLRMSSLDNVRYIKHSVKEGSNTAHVLHSIGNDYDLILVGRRHDYRSPVLSGLAEWSEIEELGVIGDLLASSDYKSNVTVLVIQQQASVVEARWLN